MIWLQSSVTISKLPRAQRKLPTWSFHITRIEQARRIVEECKIALLWYTSFKLKWAGGSSWGCCNHTSASTADSTRRSSTSSKVCWDCSWSGNCSSCVCWAECACFCTVSRIDQISQAVIAIAHQFFCCWCRYANTCQSQERYTQLNHVCFLFLYTSFENEI